MHATVSRAHSSYRVDEDQPPRSAHHPRPTLTQEEFEAIHARRALYRAVGEASPVIVVLLVLLVFAVIP